MGRPSSIRFGNTWTTAERAVAAEPEIDAHVIALRPGHPYLRLPLQFSVALESRLLETLGEDELASLRREAETELANPGRWGTTFTLVQAWGCPPAPLT